MNDEHNRTPAAVETVDSSGGVTPKQESPTQHLSDTHTDDAGVDQQGSEPELGEEGPGMGEVGGTAAKEGIPEQPREEGMTSEREDVGTQEVLTGKCTDLC